MMSAQTLTPASAQSAMAAQVKRAKTSFSAGMAALPAPRRDAMHALYAFCRTVDDIADDLPTQAERNAGLGLWRARITKLFSDKVAEDSITIALLPAIQAYGLVETDFQAIIDGMAMDAGAPIIAPDRATLDLYCDRVASAVGRVAVRIFGDAGPQAMQVAHHLGRALQLTNILRDLHEDGARARLYLPRELMATHGLPTDLTVLQDKRLPIVCRALAEEAEAHFTAAQTAMLSCAPAAMRPARIMGGYYAAILQRLRQRDWQDITQRVRLAPWEKLWIMLRYRYCQ
ncbi:MAG: presqualene diphosphate synthase HpnD [Alphaproteobacteria bacterium]|nr:presqualene diphosphate synthase HpnD [Alphaproteobacteria bacterium]